ncbi:hypothetical protein [Natronobiforma cellulositropha]|uniref:hypothetical protein n=1 Tax=Natronobiforma cellulositropha TaxID=1679076 RepID=UPI0021D56C72|nr:hypothetical protein [Natronobiforma cellulositropha]
MVTSTVNLVGGNAMLGGVLVGSAAFIAITTTLVALGIDEQFAGALAGAAAITGLWGVGLVAAIGRR